jgi:hypothetical protein
MTYIAGLKDQKIELEAPSLWDAKRKAIDLLKPKRKDLGLLWVLPVQKKVVSEGVTMMIIDPTLMN